MLKEELFRLRGGKRLNSHVDDWFDARPGELGALARTWFAEMQAAGDDVLELVHDGCPVACIDDAAFGYVNVFTGHVNVGFFTGARLTDPANLLRGTGKRMRHVRLIPGGTIDTDALRTLIRAAYLDVQLRR
ncbi:MAG: DUF1801 domain-containing protein [Pseudomonadota bacterium]